jgi:AcrR family transcriptional regulator
MVPKGKSKQAGAGRSSRRLRADAALNRTRILQAAEQVFAQYGAAASTEQVAKHAGVGIGTIFRHFPTKEALLEELLTSRLALLAAQADALAPDEEDAIFQFFAQFVRQASKKQAIVATLVSAGVDVKALMASGGRELRAAVGSLLACAQQAGLVRHDVGVAEIIGLLMGLAHAAEQGAWDARTLDRTLRIVFDGLRRQSQDPNRVT